MDGRGRQFVRLRGNGDGCFGGMEGVRAVGARSVRQWLQ